MDESPAGLEEGVEHPEGATPPTRRRARIDARTLAICVCVALLGSLLAALLAVRILQDDEVAASSSELDLTSGEGIDPDRLLAVKLETPDGLATSLGAEARPRLTLVNLWQHSCTPCRLEMPLLEAARQANPTLDIIGIASQDPVDKATAFAREMGITYPWFLDPDGTFTAEAKTAGMPTTLLISPVGQVLQARTGAFSSAEELQDFIDSGSSISGGSAVITDQSED